MIRPEDVYGIDNQGNFVDSRIRMPRLKRSIYKHAHECGSKNELYTYRPATVGNVMIVNRVLCVETGTELMLVRIEDDV